MPVEVLQEYELPETCQHPDGPARPSTSPSAKIPDVVVRWKCDCGAEASSTWTVKSQSVPRGEFGSPWVWELVGTAYGSNSPVKRIY